MKTHLREKYCKDMDVLERSTANDPEAWTKLDEIAEELQKLRKLQVLIVFQILKRLQAL